MDRNPHHVAAACRTRPRRRALHVCAGAALMAVVIASSPARGQGVGEPEFCIPMRRPYVPSAEKDVAEYRDLITAEFETYMTDVTRYFTCLDQERNRAFREVREVGDEYSAFLERMPR